MLTKDNETLAVKALTWNEAVNKIARVNPAIADIMDLLKANVTDYTFFLASYPYGSKIIQDKKAYLPLENGESIAFDDPQLPDLLRSNLNYNPLIEDPMGMILSKTSEFYLMGEDRIQPQALITPGQILGVARAVDKGPYASSVLEANLNAGCRSVFMLSKIGDQLMHSKLQEKYGITSLPPSAPQEHWGVFVDIARQANSPWRTEVLYFPRNWIKNISSSNWNALELALVHAHRKSYSIWHKVADIWNKVFHEIEEKKQLNKLYPMQSLETVKHLFKMAANIVPGFSPAINDESAPVSLLAEAYTTAYNKHAKPKYSPIIMEPTKFKMQNGDPLYDSLNYATFTQNHLESSKKRSHIALLDEIRVITELYYKGILERQEEIPSLYDVIKNITFTYYHTNPESYQKIKDASLLVSEDSRFAAKNHYEEFPNTAPFFKSCIKISRVSG